MIATSWMQQFVRRFAIALVVVFAITTWGYTYGYWFIDNAIASNVKHTDVRTVKPKSGKPVNYLIIGSDSRSFVTTKKDATQFGSKQKETGQRSDTIMVAHLDPKSQTATVVSFPRDLWVDIPNHGRKKLNAAFNYGPQSVIDTLESNFQIPIHHYLEVDFVGFKGIVNAIGSVKLFFPTIAFDKETGLNVTAPGCFEFNGDRALQYVRSRRYQYKNSPTGRWHEDGRADIGRIARQQYFIRSLAASAIARGIRNPFTGAKIINASLKSLTTDPNLTSDDFFALANAFRSTEPGAIDMQTIPSDLGRSEDGQSILRVRSADALPILNRLRSTGSDKSQGGSASTPEKPSKTTVRVLNGSDKSGIAGKTLSELVKFGFVGERAGNAARNDVAQTEVRYPTGHESYGQTVLAYLGGVGVLRPSDALLDRNVEIVIGKDFKGTASPGKSLVAPPSSTKPTTVANPGKTRGVDAPVTTGDQPLVGCG